MNTKIDSKPLKKDIQIYKSGYEIQNIYTKIISNILATVSTEVLHIK